MLNIIYFSNYSRNTQRFVESLEWDEGEVYQIPVLLEDDSFDKAPFQHPYILVAPSYGTINQGRVPAQIKKFLAAEERRRNVKAIIGTGNINFGDEYCMGATVLSAKLKKPLIAKIELAGTPQDIENTRQLLKEISNHFDDVQKTEAKN